MGRRPSAGGVVRSVVEQFGGEFAVQDEHGEVESYEDGGDASHDLLGAYLQDMFPCDGVVSVFGEADDVADQRGDDDHLHEGKDIGVA